MAKWAKFPHADKVYQLDAATLKKKWARLHKGDGEPFPKDAGVVAAWQAFHAGDFAEAVKAGTGAGGPGINAAVKAQVVYAHYLEKADKTKVALMEEAAALADARRREAPKDANAQYLYAFALGRYSQGISVAKALAEGLGGKVRDSLQKAIALEPRHADAHIALGTWHAEIINKVGAMVGGLTYGAKKDAAEKHFKTALQLNPDSPIAMTEYANGLAMMFGKSRIKEAEQLYARAAQCTPADAMERLDVEAARAEVGG